MAKIIDINKIGEKGKIDISNLKMILKEILVDISENEEDNNNLETDISVILELLFKKGFLQKDEYSGAKDRIKTLIEGKTMSNALDGEISDEVKKEIINKSKFKGFFKTYEDMLNKLPVDKAKHGDFALVKDFDAGREDINRVDEYIYDLLTEKWMLATDKTVLRNFRPRVEDGERETGEPLAMDILSYNKKISRWLSLSYKEADICRESVVVDHKKDVVLLAKDDKKTNKNFNKNDGRIMTIPNEEVVGKETPAHLNYNETDKIIKQINEDYFKHITIEEVTDEIGVKRIAVTGIAVDEYGNEINKNITDKVVKNILNNIYENLNTSFDIKIDENTKRIIPLDLGKSEEQIKRTVRTFDVDKIINRINEDYYNSFKDEDFKDTPYEEVLNRLLTGIGSIVPQGENAGVLERLSKTNEGKMFKELFKTYDEFSSNKNISVETMQSVIGLLNKMYIYLDILRDEIFERDNKYNGNKKFNGNISIEKFDSLFNVYSKLIEFKNPFGKTINNNKDVIHSNELGTTENKNVKIISSNDIGETENKHVKIDLSNENGVLNVGGKIINITNKDGELNINSTSRFFNDVVFSGNLHILESSKIFQVSSEVATYKDPIIVLNEGEKGNGVSYRASGISIDRGIGDNYFIGFDEVRKEPVSGFIKDESSESISKLGTLLQKDENENLVNGKPFVWDSEKNKSVTTDNVDVDITGCVNYRVKNNKFNLLDVITINNGKLRLASCETTVQSNVIGIVCKKDEENIYIATSGIIPLHLKGAKNGAVLYLQEDGKLGTDNTKLISKEIGTQTENGIVICIKQAVETSTTYTSYQTGSNLTKFDAVNMNEKGILVKASSEHIENSEVFGIVSKVTENSIKVVTSGFIEGVLLNCPIGSTLFLQHKGSISTNKKNNIEKAVAIKVNYGVYVDIKMGIERIGLNGKSENENMASEIAEQTNIEFDSSESFEIGDIISHNGKDFVKFSNNQNNIIGVVIKEFKNLGDKLNHYIVAKSTFVPYKVISMDKYKNLYGINIKIGDSLFYSDKYNNVSGDYKLGTFLSDGLSLSLEKEKKDTTPPIIGLEKSRITREIEKNIYYKIALPKTSMSEMEVYQQDTNKFSKMLLVNNSYLTDDNLYINLLCGNQLITAYELNGDFVITSENNIIIKGEFIMNEIGYSEDMKRLNIN